MGIVAVVLCCAPLCCCLEAIGKSPSDVYEPEIRAFEKSDAAKAPPTGGVLFTGSSTVRKWTSLANDFPDRHVINRGFGGCQIADCTYFADRVVVPYKPRLVVLRAGTNDINAGKSPEQVFGDFKAFVAKVRGKLPKARIAYLSMNATPSRWKNVDREKKANELIKGFIEGGSVGDLVYIDAFDATLGSDGRPRKELFVEDRLHFNAEGYKILADVVRPFLK